MAVYKLSSKAAADLDGIYEYTILNFGLTHAQTYLHGLHERFDALAENPARGRLVPHLARGLRRFEYSSHVVSYVREKQGVLVVRVLHRSMDVQRHLSSR